MTGTGRSGAGRGPSQPKRLSHMVERLIIGTPSATSAIGAIALATAVAAATGWPWPWDFVLMIVIGTCGITADRLGDFLWSCLAAQRADRQTEPGLAIHVICDNLSAHKAPVVHKWLLAHPRVQLHFTPTYSSWISQVERWFAELQRRCLDRGVFCSLDELTTALEDWIKVWNANARPFKWTKTADQSIDRICRYCSRISGPGH